MHAAAQLDVLHPVERKQRTLDAAEFTQRDRQAILTRVAAKLSEQALR